MLKPLADIIKDLAAGRVLALAGDEALLAKLPKGNWIGGTIPYFMDDKGGKIAKDLVFEQDLTDSVKTFKIKRYGPAELSGIPADAPENGFSLIIIPATSEAHLAYAQNAPNYPGLFMKPILGWISGVHLDDLGKVAPKAFDGSCAVAATNEAVVMHCEVAAGKTPMIGIVNLFKQGSGDAISFPKLGFQVKEAIVNGKSVNLASYIAEKGIDTKLPLVADYCGALVNISFQAVNKEAGTVDLYAPVFPGIEYRIAAPVGDYVSAYAKALPANVKPVFSCNCILNFLYSSLEGKSTKGMTGPVTFGEIAYQLLNQTLVYLEIK